MKRGQWKQKYRLNRETPGTIAGVEHRSIVVMPKGSIISVIGPVPDEPQFTEILWDGQTVRVFASDLEARSTTAEEPMVVAATDGNAPPVTAAVKSETRPDEDTPTSDAPVKVRRFTASGREL